MLESNFLKVLKPNIRAAIRPLRPRGLSETMELAQLVEDKEKVEHFHKLVAGGNSRATIQNSKAQQEEDQIKETLHLEDKVSH